MPAIRRILVPVDFSPPSKAALEYANFLAASFGAAVHVLHVWEPPGYVGPDTLAFAPFPAGRPGWEQTRRDALHEMEHFVGSHPGSPALRVEAGEPSDLILHVAREGDFDLIVMGTQGRTGLARLLIGSVADAVLRRATCPVLTIRTAARMPARERVPLL